MAKKPIIFYLSHGHGSGSDKGAASGRFIELELARKVTKACYDYLLKQPKQKRSWRVVTRVRIKQSRLEVCRMITALSA